MSVARSGVPCGLKSAKSCLTLVTRPLNSVRRWLSYIRLSPGKLAPQMNVQTGGMFGSILTSP